MTIDQFLSKIDDKAPPVPEFLLAEFERTIGHPLPADYRKFLIDSNGGYCGGSLWFRGPTHDGGSGDAGVHHIGGLRSESYFSLKRHFRIFQVDEHWIPRDLIWIMDDPFGNAICLGISGNYVGQLFFWDHENIPVGEDWDGSVESAGNLTLLANSFTEFVNGLEEMVEDKAKIAHKRKAVESGAFPPRLEKQCVALSKDYPDIRRWIRSLSLRLFESKQFFGFHGDDLSFKFLDLVFWMTTEATTKTIATPQQFQGILPDWYQADGIGFGLTGYAPGFLEDWWKNRTSTNSLMLLRGKARLSDSHLKWLFEELRKLTK